MLTDEQVKEFYIQRIEDHCNVLFDRDNLPGGVQLALEHYLALDPQQLRIGSQSLHDMSTTYVDPSITEDLIHSLLAPYARPHLAGNKRKRRYKDGR